MMSLKIKDMPTGKCPCGLEFNHFGPHFEPSPAKPETCPHCGAKPTSRGFECDPEPVVKPETCPMCGFGLRVGYGGSGLFCLNTIDKCWWYSSDYKQVAPTERTHYNGCVGSDYTLCGDDTAGDDTTSRKIELVKGRRATCEACLRIVAYCKTLPVS